jgi:hypothetical protein
VRENLVHTFITSILDRCNSLLYGLPDNLIQTLQRVQHAAARLIVGAKRRDHITPVLRDLHWLPVRQRITFKILLLTFKCLNGLAPSYLCELITPYNSSRSLRSSGTNLLKVPHTRTKTMGDRTFANAAPKLWNSLPEHARKITALHTFKRFIKTSLFNEQFCKFYVIIGVY